jgi:HSP20 family molecular chaperone IbpA
MAERQTAMTPTREERRLGSSRPTGWGGSPFRTLQRMADEMDQMFENFGLGRRWSSPLWGETGMEAWAPDIDVFQKNNELTIRADLPGLKRDEVSVEVTDDAITIQGERKQEKEEEREGGPPAAVRARRSNQTPAGTPLQIGWRSNAPPDGQPGLRHDANGVGHNR